MENPATVQHVRDSIERPLTTDEDRVIPTWLGKAWRELRRVVPGIDARNALPANDPNHLTADDVRDVLVAMVERKVRNPDGLRSFTVDGDDQTVDQALSSGQIYVTDAERLSLMPPAPIVGGGMFSIELTAR